MMRLHPISTAPHQHTHIHKQALWRYLPWMIAAAVVFGFPFYWIIVGSLSSNTAISTGSVPLFPIHPNWINYLHAWKYTNFGRQVLNTLIMALTVTIAQVLTSSMAGFALAHMHFPGRQTIFIGFIATLIVPFQVIALPIFVLMANLHWINTFGALIVPTAVNAFGIFLYRQFFLTIPESFQEAAMLDGATPWQVLWRVYWPLAKPATVTLSLLTFIAEWNSFYLPFLFTETKSMYTVQLGLVAFQGEFSTIYNLLMAATVFISIPVFILYVLGQRAIVEGIATTGTKG
ncbi:carbohydrate ABC transporter permease [Sulfobacillus thermosulfidooxidans]|uniref:carbohydrate ABC transporter permease n=1 Tax=Sulfobacillus thermosulfidooxidans TaxID=28034 RepID=UPI00031AA784|nr:carbohydrate ABC transporter permease [Sulfobacillus thermosulfidooxidans]